MRSDSAVLSREGVRCGLLAWCQWYLAGCQRPFEFELPAPKSYDNLSSDAITLLPVDYANMRAYQRYQQRACTLVRAEGEDERVVRCYEIGLSVAC